MPCARIFLILLSTVASLTAADPRDFGRDELRRSGAPPLVEAIVPGPTESWTLVPGKITGADPRGVMYGLLEAAEQYRNTGHITAAHGAPATPIRGIRYFIHNADLERDWYYSKAYWDEYFAMLARNRFNRFNLVFAHQTAYLAPPYPFWLDLPDFPAIRAKNLTSADREKNLEMLQYIARTAVAHGIDFTLGVWEHNIQNNMTPSVEGLTAANIGPYSYAALKKILALVPEISSVQMRTNTESGIPTPQQVDFYKNYVFRAIKDAGRPVLLDLRGWIVAGGMVKAAGEIGVPVRLSTKYWAEDTGRPYQPAETYANYSYLNFLEKPRSYQFYWEVWGLGSNRLLLWGNPDYVRRAVGTFELAGSEGFEIDPPLAQKGFGNRPGKWGVFTAAESRRAFWKWEFERYWLFYQLWGRLSYDPSTASAVWEDELRRRFGAAAADVMAAYAQASQVVNEIVAVHLADPNMYIWPEINPGGLTDAYREVLPSDWRYVASIPEAVANRLDAKASAKQTPEETARRFDTMARLTEEAMTRARSKIAAENREWLSTEADLSVLALLARYHAHKQRGTYLLAWFDRTRDDTVLRAARREFQAGLAVWQKLVSLTDGLYPREMAFGPEDIGHWVDKLPYVRHDLELVAQREQIATRVGRFDFGFDFGGPLKRQTSRNAYRADNYILRNTEAPGFTAVDPATHYRDDTGFGWLTDAPREAVAIPLVPYAVARAIAKDPTGLPGDVLWSDSIRGTGPQQFAMKAPDGDYRVQLLHPDKTAETRHLTASAGRLTIAMPEGDWNIAGIVATKEGPARTTMSPFAAPRAPRPSIRHTPPASIIASHPLTLTLDVLGIQSPHVRLHYRPVNQLAKFQTLEGTAGQPFTIPAAGIDARWDLMYYFEILDGAAGGWFQPDPLHETPYYVVTVKSQ